MVFLIAATALLALSLLPGQVSSQAIHGSSTLWDADFDASAVRNVMPPAPECWKASLLLFQESQRFSHHPHANINQLDTTATSKFCELLPEGQQKLLALMIAQCHLQDMGKSLYHDNASG